MEVINYLNRTVVCKLAPSEHGVGVFAIQDIAKGRPISDFRGGKFTTYTVTEGEFLQLHPEIQRLIKQRTLFSRGRLLTFDSPNSHQIMEIFLNYSDEPNTNGMIALRDIKAGEELLKNYFLYTKDPHEFTSNILKI